MNDELPLAPSTRSAPSQPWSARNHPRWGQIAGLILGVVALLWFLIRVVPKPSRAAYPCQRAAFPVASALVLSLVSLAGGFQGLRWLRQRLPHSLLLLASLTVVAGLGLTAWFTAMLGVDASAATAPSPVTDWQPGPANAPVGTALGIKPGRVVWMRDPATTLYDGNYLNSPETTWWWEANTDQKRVDAMVSGVLRSLTGTTDDAAAWAALFTSHNAAVGKGPAGYVAGESVAVKINLNNTHGGYNDQDNNCDASPHLVISLLKQLRDEARIPLNKIIIYDAVRQFPQRFDRVIAMFPGVTWMDREGGNGRVAVEWVDAITYAKPNGCSPQIPRLVRDATYLINMPLLKGHDAAGVTLSAKNHYGSIGMVGADGSKGGRDHSSYLRVFRHPGKDDYSMLVDLMGHRDLGGKTILYLMDGLYAMDINVWDVNRKNAGWDRVFGFDAAGNPAWCASVFASQDPVAIDSVGYDFIWAEFGGKPGHEKVNLTLPNADSYLRESAGLVDPATGKLHRPSGTVYAPNGDGRELPSLGTFEHWNNPIDKQYSRNLDPVSGRGIELVILKP